MVFEQQRFKLSSVQRVFNYKQLALAHRMVVLRSRNYSDCAPRLVSDSASRGCGVPGGLHCIAYHPLLLVCKLY